MSGQIPSDERFFLVLGPAIKRGDLVLSMRRPARHSDVIRLAAEMGVQTPIGHRGDAQGFMTAGGFLDRKLTAALVGWDKKTIFSEDMW